VASAHDLLVGRMCTPGRKPQGGDRRRRQLSRTGRPEKRVSGPTINACEDGRSRFAIPWPLRGFVRSPSRVAGWKILDTVVARAAHVSPVSTLDPQSENEIRDSAVGVWQRRRDDRESFRSRFVGKSPPAQTG